ncbi:MAG: hypothetical protein R3C61_13990 [Bacteroidia bacterium]
MNTFSTIILVLIVAGGFYFTYWAIQRTLHEASEGKTKSKKNRRKA